MSSDSSATRADATIGVTFFGDCAVVVGDRTITPAANVLFALLVCLVCETGEWVQRERVRRMLWPDLDESGGFHALRQALYKLRQYLGASLHVTPARVKIDRENVHADFLTLLSPGWDRVFLDTAPPRGELLSGYYPSFSAEYSEFLDQFRDRVHGRLRLALNAALDERRTAGEWSKVEALAQSCLQLDPFNEDATLALAESIALSGRKLDALAVLDNYMRDVEKPDTSGRGQAVVLRRRIAERLSGAPYLRTSEGAFVGRSASMRVLHQCWRRTIKGVSTSAFVWGEAGMGKSRLVDEFRRSRMLEGANVLAVHCQVNDVQRPLAVFADLVPDLTSLPGALGCSPESLTFLELLHAGSDEHERPRSNDRTEDAELVASGIRRAIFDLLDAVSAESHVLLIVEDAHWADPASMQLLGEVVVWADSRRLACIITSRTPPSLPGRSARELADRFVPHRLDPLSEDSSMELLRSLATIRGRSASASFVDWAARVSEGNPFYLRELLERWFESGEEYSIPPTLGALVQARVESLKGPELRLLQGCAVLRRHGRQDRLQRLLGMSNREMLEGLERLGANALILVEGAHVECRHELIVECALHQVSEVTLQALYRMAAALLESEVSGETGTAVLWDCARLWHQAGDVDRAVEMGVACGTRLACGGAPADAAKFLQRILELCDNDIRRYQVYTALCSAYHLAGEWRVLPDALRAKIALEPNRLANIQLHNDDELLVLESEWRARGIPDQLLARTQACMRSSVASPAHRLSAAALALSFADGMCLPSTAAQVFETAQPLMRRSDRPLKLALVVELIYHTTFGSLDRAVDVGTQLLDEVANSGPLERARALRFVGMSLRTAGMYDDAIECLVAAYTLASDYQIRSAVVSSLVSLTAANLERGDYASANRWYSLAYEAKADIQDRANSLDLIGMQAELLAAKGGRVASRTIIDEVPSEYLADSVLRRRSYANATHCLRQLIVSGTAERPLVEELSRLHELARTQGRHDTTAIALVAGLCSLGEGVRAARTHHQYLKHYRRERQAMAPHPMLQAVADIHVDCELCAAPHIG